MRKSKFFLKNLGFVIFPLICLFVIYSFMTFNRDLRALEENRCRKELEDLSNQGSIMFRYKLESAVNTLESLSQFLAKINDVQSDKVIETMKDIVKDSEFIRIGIADIDGNCVMTNGVVANIRERNFFQETLKGETIITDLINTINGESKVFFVSTPIILEGVTRGILYGVLDTEILSAALNTTSDYASRYIHIINQEGSFVVKSTNNNSLQERENIFEEMNEIEFENNQNVESFKSAMASEQSGYLEYRRGSNERFVYYTPLGINGWYLYSALQKSELNAHYNGINTLVLMFSAQIAAALISVFLFIFYQNRHSHKLILKNNRELKASEESFMIALAETDNIVFLYDIATKVLLFKNKIRSEQELGEQLNNVPESLVENGVIFPESAEDFLEMYDKIRNGSEMASCIVKSRTKGKPFIWERVTLKNIYDEYHHVIRTVGIIEDITTEKEKEDRFLQEQRYREALSKENLFTAEANITQNRMIYTDNTTKIKEEWCKQLAYDEVMKLTVESCVVEAHREEVIKTLNSQHLFELYKKKETEIHLEVRCYDRDRESYWVELIGYLSKEDNSQELHAIIYSRNIDAKKQSEFQSERDSLTQLYNRAATESKINHCLRDYPEDMHVFMLLDLDHFKNVNDNLGHTVGDQVLVDVSDKIRKNFRKSDIIGRLGGDEFIIFLKNTVNQEYASLAARQLLSLLQLNYSQGDVTIPISPSIGIVLAPKEGKSFKELYEKADQVLYQVKREGRNGFALFGENVENFDK